MALCSPLPSPLGHVAGSDCCCPGPLGMGTSEQKRDKFLATRTCQSPSLDLVLLPDFAERIFCVSQGRCQVAQRSSGSFIPLHRWGPPVPVGSSSRFVPFMNLPTGPFYNCLPVVSSLSSSVLLGSLTLLPHRNTSALAVRLPVVRTPVTGGAARLPSRSLFSDVSLLLTF